MERCRSGRTGSPGKRVCPHRGTEGSNPSLSAYFEILKTTHMGSGLYIKFKYIALNLQLITHYEDTKSGNRFRGYDSGINCL